MTMLLHGTETVEMAVDRIFREETDAVTNVVANRDVDAAIAEWLGVDQARITKTVRVNYARQLRRQYVKARTPKMVGGQLALFAPHFLISIGEGRLAWLDHATREQVLEWRAVLVNAFGRTQVTHDERLRQIDERIDRWGNHATFGQVERVEFHWVAADFRYDDDPDDDD